MNNLAEDINTNNIVGFKNDTVKKSFDVFLSEYKSDNTKKNYTRYIDQSFMYLTGKNIDTILLSDVQNLNQGDIREYRSYLRKHYKDNTTNQMIFACKAFFDYLIDCDKINKNCFHIKKIKTEEAEVNYGSLTESELEGLYEYCLSLKDRGMTKKLYFEFLATVTCRKSVAQKLKFNDIVRKLNPSDGKEYWVINAFDKTREVDRAITDEFYNKLKTNFDSYDWVDQKKGFIFNICDKTLEKTLNEYCEFVSIDKKGRNIVQHSIKSTGLDIIQDTFGDIKITAKAGGHASIQTPYKKYIGKNTDYSLQPSILLADKHNMDCLDELSQEQLLDLIKNSGMITFNKIRANAEKRGMI